MPKLLFSITMPCEGCSNVVKRLLLKKDDKLNIITDLKSQTVIIDGNITVDEVNDCLKKWKEASNKEVRYINTF